MAEKTTLLDKVATIPVRTVRVTVVDGPDTGVELASPADVLSIGSAAGNQLVLTDPTVSRYHVELTARPDGILIVDTGSRNGTFTGPIRIERAVVPAATIIRVGRTRLRLDDGSDLEVAIQEGDTLGDLRGRTPEMRRLMAQVRQVAPSDATMLIVGESGSGKELVAKALHDHSPRCDAPFEVVDCGALHPSLIASELFGHERGAFTGADARHDGAFQRAQGGTLFLDEIGELPREMQPALLGVLERRSFRRIGGRVDIDLDVRIIAATHRDLRREVNTGAFRLDLYYRLAVVILRVPPLRDRVSDIPVLVRHFLDELGHDEPVPSLMSPQALASLGGHYWPGNVRELRNLVEATVVTGALPPLDQNRPPLSLAPALEPLLGRTYHEARADLLAEFERLYLPKLLERAEGNVSRAAREAKLDRSYLIDLLRRHRLR